MPRVPSDRTGSARPVNGGPRAAQEGAAEVPEQRLAVEILGAIEQTGEARPTPEMYEARGRLWYAARTDPLVDLNSMSLPQAAKVAREPRVVGWGQRHEWFRNWFMSPHAHEEFLEGLLGRFLEGLAFRCASMSDKDAINTVKLLAEMADRMPKRWVKEQVVGELKGKTDDQMRQMVLDAAKALGYDLVPVGAALPPGQE